MGSWGFTCNTPDVGFDWNFCGCLGPPFAGSLPPSPPGPEPAALRSKHRRQPLQPHMEHKNEDLDLAVRCDDDTEAYGWNNESYWSGWKNKKWTLGKGRYMIEVTVRSAGQKVVGRFLLNNDHGRDQFRIEAV
jgi:hypothetical protein